MGQIATPFVLSEADLTTLDQLVSKGKEAVRKLNRIRTLQFSHQGQSPEQISTLLGISDGLQFTKALPRPRAKKGH